MENGWSYSDTEWNLGLGDTKAQTWYTVDLVVFKVLLGSFDALLLK